MPTLTWASKSLPDMSVVPFVTQEIIFPQGAGYLLDDQSHDISKEAEESYNRLILGDNLAVMASLLPAYEGKVNLIYADPPFFTNRAYPARVGRGEDSRRPREWQLAEGYADHWPDLDAYLDFLYPRLALMYRLLAPTGTLYLHLDWHANAYARLLLDEIFGPERLLNEIVWCYHGPSPIRSAFNRKHDTLLVYTRGDEYTFNVDAVRQPYDPSTVKTFASSPKAGFGKKPNLKRGKVPEDWWYFPVVARLHTERTGYPTQKPQALLERIIRASSNPGDLVADFFCGSGTTPVAATRLGRRFIANDVTYRAIYTSQARLVGSRGQSYPDGPHIQPFIIQTLDQEMDVQHSPTRIDWHGTSVSLDPNMLSLLDYWEIDPAWDGKIFHSVVQAVRPRTNVPIASTLNIPSPGDGPLCVRWVSLNGLLNQIVVERRTV